MEEFFKCERLFSIFKMLKPDLIISGHVECPAREDNKKAKFLKNLPKTPKKNYVPSNYSKEIELLM